MLAPVVVLVAVVLAGGRAEPLPPDIPSPPTARTQLSALRVAPHGSGSGYSRARFPHWERVGDDGCNAREFVLERDGRDVVVDEDCVAVSGTWLSPYDGETRTDAGDIDIDHMVPLKNAWVSGASRWTAERRRRFANDVARPQLWAVTSQVNREKGDASPDEWAPPLDAFRCTYAESWVRVKSAYNLSVTGAEKDALAGMLDAC